MSQRLQTGERLERFACFGGRCAVLVSGDDGRRSAAQAARAARQALQDWHQRFSRFDPGSELSLLNEDPRREVPASPLLVRLARAVRDAGELSEGLVDATLAQEIELAGYGEDLASPPLPPALALALAPPRRPARPSAGGRWRAVEADVAGGTVRRPRGLRIDGGGLAKGLFADVLGERLAGHAAYAVDCAGDLALGGSAGLPRAIGVESPFDGSTLHTFALSAGAVATSGITKRSWLGGDGRPAHHLLDPSTGRPAFTGVVQATALAPSALEAEIRAKAALLAGPRGAAAHLRHGGAVVCEDGSCAVFQPALSIA
jgi:FAD:protein FMN transferase